MVRRPVVFAPTGHHPQHPSVVAPVRVDPSGVDGPTKSEARSPRWRRSSPAFYVPAAVSDDLPEQRIVEAAQLIPGFGAVTGWAGLRWQGGRRWFTGEDAWIGGHRQRRDVTVVTMLHARSQPGVTISEERLRPRDIVVVDGLPVTVAARSVCFEARYAPSLAAAVRVYDMAAFHDLASLAECAEYLEYLNGWTGVPQAREAFAHAEENAWSPPEVDMRLLWRSRHDVRLLCNVPVFDTSGAHIGTPDLIDPAAGIVGEYDGAHHLAGRQRTKDVRREAAFRRLGLEYVTMLAGDQKEPHHVEWRLDDCYRRAERRPADERRWSLVRPPWWIPTDTVARRRALDDRQRARLLAHRLG